MMANEGHIEAFDIYEHKLPLIRQQADRLGIEIVTAETMDSAEGSESLYETADKLLADVPCSGLGVIRRKPEIKYKEIQDFTDLEVLQGRILEKIFAVSEDRRNFSLQHMHHKRQRKRRPDQAFS